MTPLAPFGWQQDAPPDINATNLELNRSQIAAYGEAFASAAASAAQAAAQAASIPTTQKGAANGVATLDGTTHLTAAQLPTSVATDIAAGVATAESVSATAVTAQKGAANGIATLDGTSKLTAGQLPTSVATSIAAAITTAEAASDPVGSAAAVLAQKGAANGIASLDGEAHLPNAQLPLGVGQGKPVELGNTLSGNLTLNVAAGNVFHGSLIADADLHTLTGAISGNVVPFAVRIKTNGHKLTASFTHEWLQGSEPPQEAIAALGFYTEDGGTTIYGFGSSSLPADVVRAVFTGTPPAGQFVGTDGTGGFIIVNAPGVDPAAVLKLIEEVAFLSGGHKMTVGNAPIGAGEVLVSIDGEHSQWEAGQVVVLPYALARWTSATISGATGELLADTITRVTKNSAKVEMWHSGVRVPGMQIGIRVPIGNTIKVKGAFTEGTPETETEETLVGRAVTFVFVLNSEKVWVPIS